MFRRFAYVENFGRTDCGLENYLRTPTVLYRRIVITRILDRYEPKTIYELKNFLYHLLSSIIPRGTPVNMAKTKHRNKYVRLPTTTQPQAPATHAPTYAQVASSGTSPLKKTPPPTTKTIPKPTTTKIPWNNGDFPSLNFPPKQSIVQSATAYGGSRRGVEVQAQEKASRVQALKKASSTQVKVRSRNPFKSRRMTPDLPYPLQ